MFSFVAENIPLKPTFTARDATGNVSGEGDLIFNQEWEFQPKILVDGKAENVDARPFIPDGIAVWAINKYVIPCVAGSFSDLRVPFKPLIEGP